ncbi:MAG: hypothetical protein IPM48_11200 [Saprospiraceae bacterium]|nr:hypothetical protein [Saprospiraceae bacterium]
MGNLDHQRMRKSAMDWLKAVGADAGLLLHHPINEQLRGISFPHPDLVQWDGHIPNVNPAARRIGMHITNHLLGDCQILQLRELLFYILEHGVQNISWSAGILKDPMDMIQIWDGVHFDLIKLNFALSQDWDTELGLNYINACCVLNGPFNFEFDIKSNLPASWKNKIYNEKREIGIHAILNLDATEMTQWSIDLIPQLNQFFRDWDGPGSVKLILRLRLTHDFLTNIALIRALRFLISNHFSESVILETEISAIHSREDPFQGQITQSVQQLSAIIAGPDTLWVRSNPMDNDVQFKQWLRTSLHTLHILKEESFMDLVEDPVKGSFYIEDLTQKIYLLFLAHSPIK